MKERQVLECLEELAENWYHKTGDKWWLRLGEMVTEKKKVKRWWQK